MYRHSSGSGRHQRITDCATYSNAEVLVNLRERQMLRMIYMKQMFARLPPRFQLILVLVHLYGMTQLEIAEAMHLSRRTVNRLVPKANDAIAEIFWREAVAASNN